MKITNNILIGALLVLMILTCINAVSAEDTLDANLTAEDGGEIAIDEASLDVSSADGENDEDSSGTLTKSLDDAELSEPISLPQGTVYVSESGSDENDGSSEENAIASLSHAVDIVKARENKTATVYVLNGDYTTGAIDISDDVGVSLSIIGQEKGLVTIHGTGAYIFDVYGDNLVWNFKNLDFDGLESTARTSAALVLYSTNGNFTVNNCNFRNINTKLGAIAIGNDNGNTNVTDCVIEEVTGSASSTSIITVNGDGKYILDNVEIKNCRLDENVASSNDASYLRTIIYVNTYEADVTLSNCKIHDNNGPMMSLIESRSKLTIFNTTITDNVVNTSLSGANGGDVMFWASNDNSDINVSHCIIANNSIVQSGKGLFYNQRGKINVEYSVIVENKVDKIIGSTGTITTNNNWWGTNGQIDTQVDKWIIMNVVVDDSALADNNTITLTIDFNHVKTSSGEIEELTDFNIPKDNFTVTVTAKDGEITPSTVVVNKGEVKSQTFTVTEVNDVITLTCDGDSVEITIEGDVPSSYQGIIYVNKTGSDDNNGSAEAPVASITKAIELANGGSGQIVIDEGVYTGNMYHVTQALNITGVGNVVLDANGDRLFTMGYGDNADYLILTNLVITGADHGYGQAIYSFADELILENVNLTDNPGSGSLIVNYGKLTINDCVIANHNGGAVIDSSGSKDIIINNTVIENNTVTDNAIVYASSSSGNAIVENTVFRNNTGKLGIFKVGKKTNIKDSKFIDNSNTLSYGGAISDSDSLNVTNTTFINNKAYRDSGAIYIKNNVLATITHSIFINNTANLANEGYHGDAIANKGKLTINYCVLLTNAENSLIYSESEYDVNAQYNWWGTNDNPASLNGVGTYEDDGGDDAYSVIDSSNWVFMNVTTDMVDDSVIVGDSVAITVDFNNYIDSSSALQPLSDKIPEVNVSASAVYGDLNSTVKTTENGIAEFVYDASVSAEDIVTVASANAVVSIPINVDVSAAEGIIYVSPTGNDSNDGLTKKHAVKTIAHALEIAAQGQIVLLNGVHSTGDLGGIYEDINITGEGRAVIDAGNNNRILYVGSEANVVIKNVIMINGYTADESGALLGSSNKLTLINCVLANSSAGQNNGGAIFNVGKLTIINTTIANCTAKQGGAIFSQCENENTALEIINSTFENNIATGYDMNGGGAVYAQRTNGFYWFALTVDNSTFINNKAVGTSSGGAIALVQLEATATIKDSSFIANHANGKEGFGGGAIYVSSASNYYRYGTMTITGSLFENNTCGQNGGAIYGRVTTINVSNSVLINNTDANGLAIYGYKSDSATPSITLNDNWWGSNDSPKDLTGGNNRYKPTLNRWAILTVTNDSAIEAGSTVRLTVSINNYTTGSVNGTMSKPITVKRNGTIKTTFGDIEGILENGEFVYDYTVPENLMYLAVSVDGQTVELFVLSSDVSVEVDNITARKYDKVNVEINVTSGSEVNTGVVELYAGTTIIDTIPVVQGKAIKDVIISSDVGTYDLIAKFVDSSGLYRTNQSSATLVVDGVCELWNDTFFNYFDEEGNLRDEINENELVFHGEFSDLGVNVISIPKSVEITGDEAVIRDMAFALKADDIRLSDISLMANKTSFDDNSGAIILVTGSSVELNNILVNYTTPNNCDAFGIMATSATEFKLTDSTIIFDSNNNADVTQHGLQIKDCDDFTVKGNTINASLPARDVAYGSSEPYFSTIDQELVLAVGIQNGENGNFTENTVNVEVKSALGSFPTADAIIVYGSNNLEISWNNITQIDTVNAGRASYCNAIDLYAFEGITIKNNNVLVNITSGLEAKGTAYPIQATGSYVGLLIDHNNLTSISKGPALGIYSQNYDGLTDITVTYNNINATGLATKDEYALVSGMELQDTYANVYNNTIRSSSIGSYDDVNALYGISYAQYTAGSHTFDIRDNTVYTDGKYAVYLGSAVNTNVVDNTLYAHELMADNTVYVGSGTFTIKNNKPSGFKLTVAADNITVGEDALINVTINEDANGIVTVIVDGKIYAVDNIADGKGNVTVSNLAASNYNVTVKFKSLDDKYSNCENNTVFNVAKLNSNVSISIGDAEIGNDVNITVSIPGATGHISVIINGNDNVLDLDNGNATYTIENISAGDYNITVIYPGDKNHTFAFKTAKFKVDKLASEINLTVKAGKAGEKSIIVINVTDGATGTAVIDVNGTKYTINITDVGLELVLDAGSYHVVATYTGDDKYNESVSGEETLVVEDKLPANIVVEVPQTAKVGETITINITADTDANLTVTINGEVQEIPSSNGPNGASLINVLRVGNTIQLTYAIPEAGIYNVTVAAEETPDYAAQTVTEVFEATKNDAEIIIGEITAEIGDNITITPKTESDGALTIKINGEEVTGEYEITKVGEYTVTVESAETEAYNKGFATYTFNIAEPDVPEPVETIPEITVPDDIKAGENATVEISIPNATGNVSVIIDGVETSIPLDENGTASVPIENITAGDHSVVVIYPGDATHAPTYVANAFNAAEEPVEPATNMTVIVDGKEYTADIVNGTAVVTTEPVDNNITVVVDGKEYPAEVVNGTAVVTIEPVENMTVVVDGKEYAAEMVNGTPVVTTEPVDNNITVVVDGKEYPAEIVNGTAVVTIEPVENITVVVDGKEYAAEMVNGTPVVTTEPVDNNITVVVDGKVYPAEVINGTATVDTNKTVPELPSSVVVDGVEYLVEYVNGTAVVDTNATVPELPSSVVVDGVEYLVEYVNGTATVTTDPVEPVLPETAIVDGKEYPTEVVDGKVTVKTNATEPVVKERLGTVITAEDFTQYSCDYTVGERGGYFVGLLTDSNGNPLVNKTVQIGYNGLNFNRTTNETGHFAVQIGLQNAGLYTFGMAYLDDNDYNASFLVRGITIVKKPTSIVAKNAKFKASKKTKKVTVKLETIVGSAIDGKVYLKEGKKLTLTVNGVTYKAKTDANGKATFKITKLNKKGKYKAKIKFAGDTYVYKKSKAKIKITVK